MSNIPNLADAEEIKLEALFICVPDAPFLGQSSVKESHDRVEARSLFQTPLAQGRPPTPGELSHHLVVTNRIPLMEIPIYFGSTPLSPPTLLQSFPHSNMIGEALQYKFSDGLILSAREIFYHSYSNKIPKPLLPLQIDEADKKNPDPDLNQSWACLFSHYRLPRWGSLRKTELNIIGVLQNAIHNPTIEVYLTDSLDRGSNRYGCLIKRMQNLQKIRSYWTVESSTESSPERLEKPQADQRPEPQPNDALSIQFSFTVVPEQAGNYTFQSFELNPSEGVISFHPYLFCLEHVYHSLFSELKPQGFNQWLESTRNAELTLSFHPKDKTHFEMESLLEGVENCLLSHQIPPLERKGLQSLSPSEIISQIWIEPTGEIRFSRRFETVSGQTLNVWNLPRITHTLIEALNSGVGAISSKDNKLIAQPRRGIKRDRDLKVLRHSGFFAYLLLESSQFALSHFETIRSHDLESSTGPFAVFMESVLKKLGVLLAEVEKKSGFIDLSPPPPLDKICSQNVIDLIKNFSAQMITLCQNDFESLFIHSGEVKLQGGNHIVLSFFRSILAGVLEQSNGECFLKPRSAIFSALLTKPTPSSSTPLNLSRPNFFIQEGEAFQSSLADRSAEVRVLAYHLTHLWLPPGKVLQALLPIQKENVLIYYKGSLLSALDSQELQSEFHLTETPESLDEDLSSDSSGNLSEISRGGHLASSPGSQKEKKQDIDWFELHPRFFFKGKEVEATQIERLSKEGILEFEGKIYLIHEKNLPSLKRLEAFWAKIQGNKAIEGKRRKGDSLYKLPRSQILEMLALRASGAVVTGGARWNKICKFYDDMNERKAPLDVPSTLHVDLKPYQKLGVQWLLDLYDLGLGGILADDMGLGKTIQTLSFLEILRVRKDMGHTLIVVPTSLTYNWLSESARFTPELPIRIFQSKLKSQVEDFLKQNKGAALVCTYGLFTEHQAFFSERKWNILIFDEAQNLKNISTKRTTASRIVPGKFKLCLTGTPLENHLGEFFSLLDLVVPGSLGELDIFRSKFIHPETIQVDELRYLKLKSRPLVLRRTKAKILAELPPKIETTIKLPFEIKQEKIYRDIALSWNEKIKESIMSQGEGKTQLLMLTALLRLRQVCSDPAAIPNIKYTGEPPKITVLLEALQEITESGESALVFTQFLPTYNRIKKELSAHKIANFSLHGGTSRPDREKILKNFQECNQGCVLLMTLKTGGVGLNLVKASYVFHIEPWWNPAVESQASDRAHRIGQKKAVQVYRYLMKESVEEKIEILKDRKLAKFNALFSPDETESVSNIQGSSGHLNQSDFEYLLK